MWKYYIQLPLLPVYFIIASFQNIKRGIYNAYIDTKEVTQEHKRHYKK